MVARLIRRSMRNPNRGRNLRPRSDPGVVGFKGQPEFLIVHPEITVPAGKNRLRHHGLHVLCHDADIGRAAAVVAEAIEAEAVVEPAKIDDVVFEPDVGAPAAAATAATTTMDAAASTAMDGTTSADASTRAGATAIHMGRAAASPVPCRRVMP